MNPTQPTWLIWILLGWVVDKLFMNLPQQPEPPASNIQPHLPKFLSRHPEARRVKLGRPEKLNIEEERLLARRLTQDTFLKLWTTIFYVMMWSHPTETTKEKWFRLV